MPSFRAYCELVRLPAVFTAIADVMMGYLVTHGDLRPVGVFGLIAASSCLLYWAGMVLNDVYDADIDARERPHRPIPSGRISRATAARLGWGFLVGGGALTWLVGTVAGDWRPGVVGTLLAGCVVLYDVTLKRTPLAPVAMGTCRTLNVLLGMSLASDAATGEARPWTAVQCAIALGIGIYIAGVTWFARTEARTSARSQLIVGLTLIQMGLAAVAATAFANARQHGWSADGVSWYRALLVWCVLAAMTLVPTVLTIIRPQACGVQFAVRRFLWVLILLDWIAAASNCRDTGWDLAILLLFIPMLVLEQWISTT